MKIPYLVKLTAFVGRFTGLGWAGLACLPALAGAQVSVSGAFRLDHPVAKTVVMAPGRKESISLESFRQQISVAYGQGLGGVAHFDDPKDSVEDDTILIPYDPNKTLRIHNRGFEPNGEPRGEFAIGTTESDRVAASGSRYLSKGKLDNYFFTFETGGSGLAADEAVLALGFVLLSRDDRDYRVGLRVRFAKAGLRELGISSPKDRKPFPTGEAIAIDETSGVSGSLGEANTFFLIVAPPGDSITHVEVIGQRFNPGGAWFSGLDNFAFITGNPSDK